MDERIVKAIDVLVILKRRIEQFDENDPLVQKAKRAGERMLQSLKDIGDGVDEEKIERRTDKIRFWVKVWCIRLGDPDSEDGDDENGDGGDEVADENGDINGDVGVDDDGDADTESSEMS